MYQLKVHGNDTNRSIENNEDKYNQYICDLRM